MQLDSDQVIAELIEPDGYKATLEVRGAVEVWWNEKTGDATEGECYKYPPEFPDKLKQLIANQYTSDEGHWTLDPRVYISDSNWFEVFVHDPDYPNAPSAYVDDAEGQSKEELYDLLKFYIDRCREGKKNPTTVV